MARRVQEELDLEAEFERSSQRVEEERVKKAREGMGDDKGIGLGLLVNCACMCPTQHGIAMSISHTHAACMFTHIHTHMETPQHT